MTEGSEETYGVEYLRECASSHEPGARLLGDMPASAIVAVCDELAGAKVDLEGWAAATGYATPEEYAASDEVAQHTDAALTGQPEPEDQEDTESLIEQLDEALCTLLHNGDEIGTHAPREHLALFYVWQAEQQLLPGEDKQLLKRFPSYMAVLRSHERDWVAAKAKIAELERQHKQLWADWLESAQKSKVVLDAAKERADGAEGRYRQVVEISQANERAYLVKTDQLAARVTELEAQLEAGLSNARVVEMLESSDVCTTSERKVLDAWSEKHISDEALDFIAKCGSGPVRETARAELANRAAKAGGEAP